MASHRKAGRRPLTVTGTTTAAAAARTAATLALAGAAGASAFDGAAHADPRLTPAQVKSEVDRLYREAEVATEQYDGAKEKSEATGKALDRLRDEAARRTGRLTASRDALGSIATAQYRSGGIDPAVQLALSATPEDYLERAAFMERAGSRRAAAVRDLARGRREIEQLRQQADAKLAELRVEQKDLRDHQRTVRDKLRRAQRLLSRLTAEQRARLDGPQGAPGQHGAYGDGASRAGRAALRGPLLAPNARAARAISFAYAALGKPYVWGAAGPDGFDCSGLTQAAWKSAGVSLPRTTYTQINAGTRVSRSQLAPGDLVFFYSGVSHVGVYIGNGLMIHAPHPGAPVRVAPIDSMPFAGATRPA